MKLFMIIEDRPATSKAVLGTVEHETLILANDARDAIEDFVGTVRSLKVVEDEVSLSLGVQQDVLRGLVSAWRRNLCELATLPADEMSAFVTWVANLDSLPGEPE